MDTTGEQGVDTTVDGYTLHLALPEVTRAAARLTDNVELTIDKDRHTIDMDVLAGTSPVGPRWILRQRLGSATGLSLLTGHSRYYPEDVHPRRFHHPP
ncbi:hypothetical protein [Actinomyces howellii]|uniref:Uncharacterized protein n=1 Tax=Actinomyces howellii TaxID=52771 RepID=A0A448HFE9_9ACTO|nr:hypothetical protein [Actinomyces howellii]VEG27065.1 Uncharacterised protein [Actinomyces howellii]